MLIIVHNIGWTCIISQDQDDHFNSSKNHLKFIKLTQNNLVNSWWIKCQLVKSRVKIKKSYFVLKSTLLFCIIIFE